MRALAFAACVLGLITTHPVHAQDKFPSRPITIVVPFAPGGTADLGARLLGARLTELTGFPTLIENRGGAAGAAAAKYVAVSEPDGHTLLLAYVGTHALNQGLFKSSHTIRSRISRRSFRCGIIRAHWWCAPTARSNPLPILSLQRELRRTS